MPILTKPSSAPRTALVYITIGAIFAVCSGTSYLYFDESSGGAGFLGYLRTCFLMLGLVLMVIGFTVGQISRGARKAELPPSEATAAVARAERSAAAQAPVSSNGAMTTPIGRTA